MKRILALCLTAASLAAVFCGCSTTPGETLSPSDLTLDELENRMAKATDPEGHYSSAQSFVMRQELTTKRFMDRPLIQMVETKFMRPDFFKITTYDDNQPSFAIISNGESSWTVNFKTKKVQTLDADSLRQARELGEITKPGSRLSRIFKKVEVRLCRIGDDRFYKLSCQSLPDSQLDIYVDADTYQTARVVVDDGSGLKYDSSLRGYGLYEGVRIPEETTVRSGSGENISKVIYYKLNTPIDTSEFRPPVF